MDVVVILVYISLVLVLAALAFFLHRLREGDFEHGDRLSLLPLAEDQADAAGKQRESISTRSSAEPGFVEEERATHEHRS